ncbi:MAG: hypothetical protein KJ970_14870 [Candidatus Eisenbacteria bacterium]|uniref:Uncharacterized protein n=1 Tax=Eiseniibacteriota bacterium TaxID=2212470 RepID=A0A948RZT2_UNCEI|nr:hypothetical protein [Candidatus Eisenbacteria bacterium]
MRKGIALRFLATWLICTIIAIIYILVNKNFRFDWEYLLGGVMFPYHFVFFMIVMFEDIFSAYKKFTVGEWLFAGAAYLSPIAMSATLISALVKPSRGRELIAHLLIFLFFVLGILWIEYTIAPRIRN